MGIFNKSYFNIISFSKSKNVLQYLLHNYIITKMFLSAENAAFSKGTRFF